jgi:TolB-like protein/DNA-binding winged helix-turn-helix (wHTH) protein/Flp pilus assembly protein TadD
VATSAQSPSQLRFDSFEVDLRSGELRKHGIRLRLQDQPAEVLRVLLERRGDIVTREELKQKLWPADTFVDFDDGLNTAVKKLRDALSDSAEHPRYIETIPRRGYRFIAAVIGPDVGSVQAKSIASSQSAISLAAPASATAKQYSMRVVSLLLAILALGALGYRFWPRPSGEKITSIVVLPLENLSGDPTQDYFAAGMTEALTTELARSELARSGTLRVISRSSAVLYKDKPLPQIVRELNVDAIIEGSVVRAGSRVRVTAQLVNARRDKHLWADNYDRDFGDVLALQSEIAGAVARQIQIAANQPASGRPVLRSRVKPEAYDDYLRALAHTLMKTQQENDAAIGLLEKSIAADPGFALAFAALSEEYRTKATIFRSQQAEWNQRSFVAAQKALALDPDLPEAYVARGHLRWSPANHWSLAAIADFKRALTLNPNLSEAHNLLGQVYLHIGLLEQAKEHLDQAVSLDPTSLGARMNRAYGLVWMGRAEDGLLAMRDSKKRSPTLWTYQKADALEQLGRIDEAEKLLPDEIQQEEPDTAGLLESMQAVLAARTGKRAAAENNIRAAVKRGGEEFQYFHHVAYSIGSAYALMNRRKQALQWLRRAAENGFSCYPFFEKDPNLENLRGDPDFQQWMARLKKDWEYYRATI